MIASFRSRRLESLYNGLYDGLYDGNERRVKSGASAKVETHSLGAFSRRIRHEPYARGRDIPGFRLHAPPGGLRGYYAVSVSENWRVTFMFDEDVDANDVANDVANDGGDYVEYLD